MQLGELLGRISAQRLQDLALSLVQIPSPTGDSVQVTEHYADYLRRIGLEVELRYDVADRFPKSPSLAARLRGGPGPTLQLDGHLDTIPAEHAAPYCRDGIIHGRGATDMKSGLTAMAEAARVLMESGARLKGNLLLTAHGLHEAPTGRGEGLSALVAHGIHGDMAIVTEGRIRELEVVGLGQSTFEIVIRREGEVVHELQAPPGAPHPILVGHELVGRLLERNAELARVDIPLTGPESIFIGIFEGGDFYNRLPTTCRIMGTRRYAPEKSHRDIQREFEELVDEMARKHHVAISLDLRKTREGYRMGEDNLARRVLQAAAKDVLGQPLVEVGQRSVGDVSILTREAGIPAGYLGVGHGAHSSNEHVSVDELVLLTRMLLAAICHYPGLAEAGN